LQLISSYTGIIVKVVNFAIPYTKGPVIIYRGGGWWKKMGGLVEKEGVRYFYA
jgi:hypothetical protein